MVIHLDGKTEGQNYAQPQPLHRPTYNLPPRKLGLSKKELADLAGSSLTYVYDLEKGKDKPSSRVLFRITAALEVSVDELNRHARYLWKDQH